MDGSQSFVHLVNFSRFSLRQHLSILGINVLCPDAVEKHREEMLKKYPSNFLGRHPFLAEYLIPLMATTLMTIFFIGELLVDNLIVETSDLFTSAIIVGFGSLSFSFILGSFVHVKESFWKTYRWNDRFGVVLETPDRVNSIIESIQRAHPDADVSVEIFRHKDYIVDPILLVSEGDEEYPIAVWDENGDIVPIPLLG